MSLKIAISAVVLLLLGFVLGRVSFLVWPGKPYYNSMPGSQAESTTLASAPPSSSSSPLPTPLRSQQPPLISSPAHVFLKAGETGRDGGLVFTLESWSESQAIPKRSGGAIQSKEGGKFVVVRLKFQNDGKESADIHCNFHMGSKLFDSDGRKFDHIKSLYEIEGNTRCNDSIQPGFGSRETIAFELPTSFKPNYVMFWDPREIDGERQDSFGEKSALRFKLE